MARYRLDTNMAGAFLNIYQPIGDDPVVRSLEGDWDLIEYFIYRRKERESQQQQFISIEDMCFEVDKYLTKHYYRHGCISDGECREG